MDLITLKSYCNQKYSTHTLYLLFSHLTNKSRKRSQMSSTMLPEGIKIKCEKIDWLEVFFLSFFFFLFTFFYLFLCLSDDASWSKSGGDVGEVEWFTGVMVTWGCWGVLRSWWMFGTESVALTEVWNLFTAEEKEKKNHICEIIPGEMFREAASTD